MKNSKTQNQYRLSRIAKALAVVLAASLSSNAVAADESFFQGPVYIDSNGRHMFELYYGETVEAGETPILNNEIRTAINNGLGYWADMFSVQAKNTSGVRVFITPYYADSDAEEESGGNASALSFCLNEKDDPVLANSTIRDLYTTGSGYTPMSVAQFMKAVPIFEMIENGDYSFKEDTSPYYNLSLSHITVGKYMGASQADDAGFGWYAKNYNVLCQNEAAADLAGTIRHEMGHALGISASTNSIDSSSLKALLDDDQELVFSVDKLDSATIKSHVGKIALVGENFTPYYIENDDDALEIQSFMANSGGHNMYQDHLYDYKGTKAQAGMYVVTSNMRDALIESGILCADDQAFLIEKDNADSGKNVAYFRGEQVAKVLDGAQLIEGYDGIPVNGFEGEDAELSHFQTAGMMSHEAYTNLTTFLEVELAAMQDMGYQFDIRNYFGHSVYGNGKTIVNDYGYSARSADGSSYIKGVANKTALGVGLDVFGSNNTITQAADILSAGTGAAGIRVNGTQNNLTVAKKVKVKADGDYAMGILFSAGSGHTLSVEGNVSANGKNGNALQFDYGSSSNGAGGDEYHGSYINYKRAIEGTTGAIKSSENLNIFDEDNLNTALQGALMDKVSISGTVESKNNAIYIGKNALVRTIEFNDGAQINGNITSDWKNFDTKSENSIYKDLSIQISPTESVAPEEYLSDLVTEINFNGQNINFNGSINGAKNTSLLVEENADVSLMLSEGSVDTLSVAIANGAFLKTNADFNLTDPATLTAATGHEDEIDEDNVGYFINAGTLDIGSDDFIEDLSISGNYVQQDEGTLIFDISSDYVSSDSLEITGSAELSGNLTFVARRSGMYKTDKTYSYKLANLVKAQSYKNVELTASLIDISPTLTMSLDNSELVSSDDVISINFTRNYEQYIQDKRNLSLARALQANNSATGKGIEKLYAAIDFSLNGHEVNKALNKLQPHIYEELTQSIFTSQKQNLSFREDSMLKSSLLADGIYTRVQPFGMHESRQRAGAGYRANNVGVIAELDKVDSANVYGMYAVFNKKELKAKDKQSSASDYSLYAGIDTLIRPFENSFFITSDLGLGFDSIEAKRNVAFNGYSASADKKYTAMGAYLSLGTGYDFNLDAITLTPFIKLNYNMLHQGSVKENGNDGIELSLGSKTFKSLSSSAGLRAQSKELMADDVAITISGSIAYNYELLKHYGTLHSNFREAPDARFSFDVRPYKDSSVEAMSSIKFSKANFSFSTDLGLESYQGSGTDSFLRLNFGYSF